MQMTLKHFYNILATVYFISATCADCLSNHVLLRQTLLSALDHNCSRGGSHYRYNSFMGADLCSTLGTIKARVRPKAVLGVGKTGSPPPAMRVRAPGVLPRKFLQTVHFGNILAIIGPENARSFCCVEY